MAIIYGAFPGVKARVTGNRLGGVILGRLQKSIFFGKGDTQTGEAEPNTPKKIRSRVDANRYFGVNSELSDGIAKGLQNGSSTSYTWGIMVQEFSLAQPETITGSGTLSFNPISTESDITVTEDVAGTVIEHELVYENNLTSEDVLTGVAINPETAETAHADGATVYNVDYSYEDWDSAIDAADKIVRHGQNGVYVPLRDNESVNAYIDNKVLELRPFYKMICNVIGVQANGTDSEGNAILQDLSDTGSFGHPHDSDYTFAHGPVRLKEIYDENNNLIPTSSTILGGIGGIYAGNDLTDPVVGEKVNGYRTSLVQQLGRTEQDQLRDKQVIPIDDTNLNGVGGIYINDNISTSTSTDWKRDYHRRRVVDQTLLIARKIGEQARNRLINDDLLQFIKNTIESEIKKLIRVGLLKGTVRPFGLSEEEYQEQLEEDGGQGGTDDPTGETAYFVEVEQSGPDEVSIVVGITPSGVNKRIDQTIIVEDFRTQTSSSISV